MRLRALAFVSLSALVVSAQASFELLLVADNGANTSFTDRKIHRFDPVSGSYLGNFGGFANSITGTYLRQSTNSLFVTTTFDTTEWDYNTGQLKGSYGFGISFRSAVNPSGTRVAFFDSFSDFIVRDFPTGFGGSTIGSSVGTYVSGVFTSATTMIAYDDTNNRFRNITTNTAVTTGTVTLSTTSALGPVGAGQMAMTGGANFVVMPAGGTGQFHHYTPGSTSSGTGTIPGGGTGLGAAAAHNGFFLSSTNAGVGRVTAFGNNFQPIRQFGSGVLISPVSMQSVLAPEPGSMLALGLGALVLLRRRR